EFERFLYIAMEYLPLRSLPINHPGRRRYSLSCIRDITQQIFEGVEFLHAMGIAHRDLNPNLHLPPCRITKSLCFAN
ncbi:hypothetical protein FPQ18DRAFT_265886, partial [Pyronema domesticum]